MNYLKATTRIFRMLGLVLLTIFLTSCDDFLTESPQSEVGVTDFYKTNDDFVQAVNAIYDVQQSIYTGNQAYILNDQRSDNLTCGVQEGNCGGDNEGIDQVDKYRMTSTNPILGSFWQSHYDGIARANRVITYIEEKNFDNKEEIIGQAKALRALFYFNLVREFGSVQYVTEPNVDVNTDRVSVDSVYTLIVSDLKDAANSLPDIYTGADEGRITKGAAKSLLGTVYLTRQNFTDAETVFGEVVNSGIYELRDNYGDLWITDEQGKGNESVWRVIYAAGNRNKGSKFPNWYAPKIGNSEQSLLGQGKGTAFGFFIPTYDIINAYSDNDTRKDCIAEDFQNVTDSTTTTIKARYVKCYVQQPTTQGGASSGADWYIMRYADVLLRYAEALNENNNGNPLSYVNQVRRRAGLGDTTASGQAAIRDLIYKEERLESPFEGHRWNDLVRTGRAVSVINSKIATDSTTVGAITNINDRDMLYPIPNRVITTSGIEQNPGY